MSAIAGVVHVDGRDASDAMLAAIAGAAPPRGFDGVTRWHSGPAGMIRFAHATTPEAEGESQPFTGASGAVCLYDGRVDNRGDLLAMLGARGAALTAAPDGAIALALFEAIGRDFVKHIAGDFCIAVWEPGARRLSLYRSALGWRPINWTFAKGTFAFATDARALILGLGLEKRLNEGALAEYLAQRFVSETDTFWEGIEKVPQGAAVILEGDKVTRWAWHDGPFEDLTDLSMEEHVERFLALFDAAIIGAARANGPVTSQLSGGLDSSSIVCRAHELYQAGKLDRPVGAITARFPGKPHDESEWSMAVEAHLGITAEVAGKAPFVAEDAARWCAESYHMPVKPNALDTLAGVCAILRADGRRVLLTGEGGDDWLNGSFAHWPDLLLRGRWLALFRHGAQQWPGARPDVIARRTLYPAVMPIVSAKHRAVLFSPHLDWRIPTPDWLRPEWMRKVDLVDRWQNRRIPRPGLRTYSERSRYAVFSHGTRNVVPEAALAWAESQGIEIRHPFHDMRLTRFYMGAAGNHMRRFNLRKVILREAMRGTLPEKVRTRTDKARFVDHTVATIDDLFAERPAHELLPAKLGWVDPERIAAMHAPFAKWRAEGSKADGIPETPWGAVWFTIATDLWLRNAVGM